MSCPRYVELIQRTENVGDTLIKINNNFSNLKNIICELKDIVDSTVITRTFFYYGTNTTAVDSSTVMQNNVTSRPSNTTIENFVNNVQQLNLPAISKTNDEAIIIYQKTGYLSQEAVRTTTGSLVVPAPPGFSGSATVTYSTTTPDKYTIYVPVFIIWRLIFNGTKYTTSLGFPKFSQSYTSSQTTNWNKPQNWVQYN